MTTGISSDRRNLVSLISDQGNKDNKNVAHVSRGYRAKLLPSFIDISVRVKQNEMFSPISTVSRHALNETINKFPRVP